MRILGLILVLAALARAADPVPDAEAKEALAEFQKAFRVKDIGEKQNAVYNLHDVPSPLVLKQLEKLLRNRDPRVRNVAALAVGGQSHDLQAAGKVLMKAFQKDFKSEEVVSSVLEGITELKYLGYWPAIRPALKDERSSVVVRILDMLGNNQDWRAFPELVEMFRIVMPKRASWSTGEVTVDTGAAGDADQKAAEAAFNKKYGRGGSKSRAKARRQAQSYDLRNFSTQLRKCMKKITGQDFDNAMDLEDWWVENYVLVAQKAAEMDGKSPESVVAKAKAEQAKLRAKVAEDRRKLEEELAKRRGS